jgi:hypothetical protein
MLAFLRNFVTRAFINGALAELIKNPDTATTAIGAAAAVLIGAHVDWSALIFAHQLSQAGIAIGAILAAALGYYTNKPHKGQVPEQLAAMVRSMVAELQQNQVASQKAPK